MNALDKFQLKLVPEGLLIFSETGGRQDNKILSQLAVVLGELLDFAQFLKVRARHLEAQNRADDEWDISERQKKFQAEALEVFKVYDSKFKELKLQNGKGQSTAAMKFVKKFCRVRSDGETRTLIFEGRRLAQSEKNAQEYSKPRPSRLARLDPSLFTKPRRKRKKAVPRFVHGAPYTQ